MQRPFWVPCILATAIASSLLTASASGAKLAHCVNNDAAEINARQMASNVNEVQGEKGNAYWSAVGNDILQRRLNMKQLHGVAKNVIFFIGDGMSIATLTAARIYMGQLENKTGESEMLSFEKFPYTGLSKTYCVDSQVADSACSATAYLTGVKGNIETIGVTGTVVNRDCSASDRAANRAVSSMRWAQLAGKRTGVVTSMRVTHATPAGAYANTAQRDWECDGDVAADPLADPKCVHGSPDIARQLIERDTGRDLNLIMGGGRAKFLSKTTSEGQRIDGRNLIDEWLNINRTGLHSAYVSDRSALNSINTHETDYLLGLFASSHLSYRLLANKSLEPSLEEMTEAAIRVLANKTENGYYLFVEGGNIDWAHHETHAHVALDETVMLSNAVKRAVEMTSRDDTLIVVTSDHSHTMTLNGYPHRGSDILGHPKVSVVDKMPYSTLSYANGPSAKPTDSTGARYNLSADNTSDPDYRFPAMVNLPYETHGGDDVAVFALGPWAHLFVGNYEQNYIPYAIGYAANMGPGPKREDKPTGSSAARSFDRSALTNAAVGFIAAVLFRGKIL